VSNAHLTFFHASVFVALCVLFIMYISSLYTISLHRPAILFLVFLFLFFLSSLQTPPPLPVCYLSRLSSILYRCAKISLISFLWLSVWCFSCNATHFFLISSFVIIFSHGSYIYNSSVASYFKCHQFALAMSCIECLHDYIPYAIKCKEFAFSLELSDFQSDAIT